MWVGCQEKFIKLVTLQLQVVAAAFRLRLLLCIVLLSCGQAGKTSI